MAAHVRATRAVVPIASLINVAIPIRVRSVLSGDIWNPDGAPSRRNRAIVTFRDIDANHPPYRARWPNRLPAGSPARALNSPLLRLPGARFDYPDKRVAQNMALGMPIAGDIPACDALLSREKPATTTMGHWAAGIGARNSAAIGRVEGFRSTELGPGRWRKTLAWIAAGWLTETTPLTPQDRRSREPYAEIRNLRSTREWAT